MSNNFEITNFNFIVPCFDETSGKELKVYVPQPIEKEMRSLASILGPLYSKAQKYTSGQDMLIFIKDYEVLVEEIADKLENGETKIQALNAYLERCLLGAKIYYNDGGEKESLTADEEAFFKGALVFISALYRYLTKFYLKTEMSQFFTSLTPMEFRASLQKHTKDSTAGGVAMRAV